MTSFLFVLAAVFGFGVVLVVARALIGPTIFDRLLATNVVGTLVVMIMVILSLAMDRTDFVDLALLYALLNFIGVIATLKYIRFGHLGRSERPQAEDEGSFFQEMSRLKAAKSLPEDENPSGDAHD